MKPKTVCESTYYKLRVEFIDENGGGPGVSRIPKRTQFASSVAIHHTLNRPTALVSIECVRFGCSANSRRPHVYPDQTRSLCHSCQRLGALERVLQDGIRRRIGHAADRLCLSVQRQASQCPWAGRAAGGGRPYSSGAGQQRFVF